MSLQTPNTIEVIFKRRNILEYICEHEPDKRELVDELPKSRPTIDRAIRELEENELVDRSSGSCQPTYVGKIAYEHYIEYENYFETLEKAVPLLSSLSSSTNLNRSIFVESTIFYPSEYAPYEPIEPLRNDIKKAENIKLVTKVFLRPYIDQIFSKPTTDTECVDIIINNKLVDELLEYNVGGIEEFLKTNNFVFESKNLPEYSLFLIDRLY